MSLGSLFGLLIMTKSADVHCVSLHFLLGKAMYLFLGFDDDGAHSLLRI